jgi:VWFA-related protein
VSVTDRKGHAVPNLSAENFRVYEDGQMQKIVLFKHEDIPVTVGLLVDNSSSMLPRRRQVIEAANVFARLSNPQDQIFVVNFSDSASLGLPENVAFTDEPSLLTAALSRTAGGKTALYDALAMGLEHLRQASLDKKALIVVSDGGDNASQATLSQVLQRIAACNAMVYTVGILDEQESDQNPRALSRLAKAAGGEAYFPKSALEIRPICEEIARDLREQYTIGYVPPHRDSNAYRKIKVQVNTPGKGRLVARTREGYSARDVADH